MENQELLTVIGILFAGVYAIQIFIIKKLNFTCTIVGKIKTFLKLVHPDKAQALD